MSKLDVAQERIDALWVRSNAMRRRLRKYPVLGFFVRPVLWVMEKVLAYCENNIKNVRRMGDE